MKISKKNVITASLAVTLAAAVVLGGGTYAYLQSSTGDTVNTFNTNKVMVELQETTGNTYNIVPGTSQDKDPTVTVENTVDAYVYVEVTDNTQELVDYEIAEGWTPLDGYERVYYRTVAAGASEKSFSVLAGDKVYYSAELENSDMLDENGALKTGIELTFKAYAIQKAPFNDPADAWKQVPAEVATQEELAAAFAAGKNVALTAPIAINDVLSIPEGESVVLDMSGQTITSAMVKAEGADGTDRPIVNYGTLIVTGNGTIDTTAANGFGAIRNYGDLTIENGTFKGDDQANGSAIDTQSGATTVINGGTYYATAAIMNRAGGTIIINDGDFEGVSNDNEGYGNGIWAYAVQNYGDMTINGGTVHGSMNGGIASNQGTVTINDGYFSVEAPPSGRTQSFYVLVTNTETNGQFIINGGTFEQKNGTDRLLGGFNGMPSWDAKQDLEANGYTVNGGKFILNGTEVTIG